MPAFIQSAQNALSGSTITATLPSAVSSGNLIVIAIAEYGSTINFNTVTITDSRGNSYYKIAAFNSSNINMAVFAVLSASGGSCTVTAVMPRGSDLDIIAAEYSGYSLPYIALDGSGTFSDDNTDFPLPTVTTTGPDLILCVGYNTNANCTWSFGVGTAFTIRNNTENPDVESLVLADRVVSGAGTYNAGEILSCVGVSSQLTGILSVGLKPTSTPPPPPPPVITSTSINFPITQSSYTATLTATGGQAPLSWSLVSGTLPGGLTLNSVGTITGIATDPPGSSSTVSIRVTDALSQTGTASVTVHIYGLAFFSVPDGNPVNYSLGVVGQGFRCAVSANYAGGPDSGQPVENFIFSLDSGSLPPGLSLIDSSHTGTGPPTLIASFRQTGIDGTPTAAGTYDFVVRMTDTIGATGSHSGQIVIVAQQANEMVIPPAFSGYPYSFQIRADIMFPSLVPPLTYVFQDQTPTNHYVDFGFTLTSSGLLQSAKVLSNPGPTGFPVNQPIPGGTLQSFAGTLFNVTDAHGSFENGLAVALDILSETPHIISAPPNGLQGVPYNFALSATGGVPVSPPYTYLNSGPPLPPGLSISSDGHITGTPTTAGTWNPQIILTDSIRGATAYILTIVVLPGVLASTSCSITILNRGCVQMVPDSAIMYLAYGVMRKIYSDDSELKDRQKALYCGARYEEGVNLFRAIMREELGGEDWE